MSTATGPTGQYPCIPIYVNGPHSCFSSGDRGFASILPNFLLVPLSHPHFHQRGFLVPHPPHSLRPKLLLSVFKISHSASRRSCVGKSQRRRKGQGGRVGASLNWNVYTFQVLFPPSPLRSFPFRLMWFRMWSRQRGNSAKFHPSTFTSCSG